MPKTEAVYVHAGLRLSLILLAILFVTCPAFAQTVVGRVVSVADGDTLTLLCADRSQVPLRLHGVDCPEMGQAFGQRAKQFTSAAVFGKEVRAEFRDGECDRYRRIVVEVFTPDVKSLNRELVRAGLAWWYRRYAPTEQNLAALEQKSRTARRGLCAAAEPIPR